MLTALESFIKKYPKKWKEILAEPPYNITFKEDGEYTLLKYNQLAKDTNWYDPIVQECRGIILNSFNAIVCHGFDRFYNLGEPYAADIYWNNVTIREKMDGSLIKIWNDRNGLHISTNGSIDAYKVEMTDFFGNSMGRTFGSVVESILGEETLNKLKGYYKDHYKETMMFELISPYNRIVVDYGDEMSMYYLGSRDEYGQEFWDWSVAKADNVKIPKEYKLDSGSAENVKALVETLEGHEGVVVCDSSWRRVKVKNITYFLKHRNMTHVSAEDMLYAILNNEVEEFKTILNNKSQFTQLEELIENCENLKNSVEAIVKTNLELSRKDFAIKFKNHIWFPLLMDCYLSGGEVVDLSKISAKKILKLLGGE